MLEMLKLVRDGREIERERGGGGGGDRQIRRE